MRIVYLSPEAVVPANTGGRIVVYNKIKNMALAGNEVYLFSIVDSDDEAEYQDNALKGLLKECHSYNRNKNKFKNLMLSLLYPYAVASRNNSKLRNDLIRLIDNKKVDVVICELPQMAKNLIGYSKNVNVRFILSQQNIEYLTMRNIGKTFKNIIKKIIYSFDSFRLEKFEKKLYHSQMFDAYIFVSSDDRKFFINNLNFNEKPTKLVPIGADEHNNVEKEVKENNVLIVGKMSYQPNVDGITWFCDNIWNKVLSEIPDAKLIIVGKDPTEEILQLSSESIVVTGTVDSVEPFYRNAAVVSIPILSGGGVKTKLIEAASYKVPIVCTTFAVKGTNFNDGDHLMIAQGNDDYADNIVSIIKQKSKYTAMADRAYELFLKEYTWKGICDDLMAFLKCLIK